MTIGIANLQSQVGTSVSSITTPAISTTTGNLAVVNASRWGGGGAFTSITSAGGTTAAWADSIAEVAATDGTNTTRQQYANITAGNASHTFIFTLGGSNYPSMVVYELSGLAASPLGEVNSGTDNAGPYALDLVIPDTAERLLLAFGGVNAPISQTVTQTGSFVQDKNIGVSAASEMLLASHLASTTSGTKTFSFSATGPDNFYTLGIRAFLAPSTTPLTVQLTDDWAS